MGTDIGRNDGGRSLVEVIPAFKRKQLTIDINEKINQIKNLMVTLERMKSVDMKSIELKIDVLKEQVRELQKDFESKVVSEAKSIDEVEKDLEQEEPSVVVDGVVIDNIKEENHGY